MSHGAAQPIQSPNDESVTGLQDLQASPEARSIVLCTGQLVSQHEILRDALLSERVKLKAQILVVRANAGVSNKTPVLGRGVHGAVFWCESRCQSLPLRTHPHGDRFGIQAGRRTNPCLKTGPFLGRFRHMGVIRCYFGRAAIRASMSDSDNRRDVDWSMFLKCSFCVSLRGNAMLP